MRLGTLRLVAGLIAAGMFVLVLAACGTSATATPTATPTQVASVSTPTPTQSAFQQQWNQLAAAAKQEGELDIVAGGVASRTYKPVVEAFGQQYGIAINFSTGSSSEQSSRVLAERSNGDYTVDIAMTGANTSANAYIPAGALDPVESYLFAPDVIDKSLWFQGHYWWGDTEQKYNFIYSANVQNPPTQIQINTDKVNPADITSLKDFLDPKYNGKIGAALPTTGGGQEQYFEVYVDPDLGPDFIKQMIQTQNLFYSDDYTQIENQLADGSLYATIFGGAQAADIDKMHSQGLPVDHLLKQVAERGMLVSAGSASNIGVFNHPAHPNATKLFLNWWLSQEGQTAMQTLSAAPPYVSLREDVTDPGKTLPETRRQPGKQYLYVSADPKYLAQRTDAINQVIAWYNQATGQ